MRLSMPLAIALALISAVPASGQDLEPTLVRAAARIGDQLVDRLPDRAGAVKALAVVPDWGARREAGQAVIGALVDKGFKVVDAESARSRDDVLFLKVSVVSGEPNERLVVETREKDPQRFVCAYGNADWADEKTEEMILIVGPLRRDPAEATDAARREARRRVMSRAGVADAEADVDVDVLRRVPLRTFVGAVQQETVRLHRAFLRVDLGRDAIRRVQRATEREERRQAIVPWARAGGMLALALILGLSYVCADLKTKGYMTGRLRLLFGTLFALGAGVCWSVPL